MGWWRSTGLSEELHKRAINFSRCNFASWQVSIHITMLHYINIGYLKRLQVILNFVKDNQARIDVAAKIFKALKEESTATLR